MSMKKKGQITAFIIIGVVLIALFLLIYYYKAEIMYSVSKLPIIGTPRTYEAAKVEDFILDCMKDRVLEGVELLGLQGGYIYLPGDKVARGSVNMFSNSLEVVDNLNVAYWYYQQSNRISVVNIRDERALSLELEKYLDEQIDKCIDDFSSFEDYNIEFSESEVDVEIRDDNIKIVLDMPVDVEVKGQEFSFKRFVTNVEVSLGDLLDIAKKIVENEIASDYLEEKTIDMMIAYDEIPYSGSDLSCGKKVWVKDKVISDFKNILFENIHQIRVAFTDYELPDESHSFFEWHVTRKRYDNVNVALFFSDRWPFYLDVIPDDDGILKSQQVTEKMGEVGFLAKALFCMNDWHFVYDIKYPVLVTLYDKKNDYTFQFAMQVVLDRNQPREAEIIPEPAIEVDRDYCKNTKYAESSVYTYEDLDGINVPLAGVDVKYKCITHLCEIGTSNFERGDAFVETMFPSCVGGSVVGYKDGYHKSEVIDVDSNKEFSIPLVLEKIRSVPVKIHLNREGGGAGSPTKYETVFIELEEPNKDYKYLFIYPDETEIQLIPGDYNVKMYVLREGPPVTIPGREIENCFDIPKGALGLLGATEEKCTKVKIPAVELDSFVTGGAEFEWTVDNYDIEHSDYVKFYLSTDPTPGSLSELSSIDLKQEDVLIPVFLNE